MNKQQMIQTIENRVQALRDCVTAAHNRMFEATGMTYAEFQVKAKDWQWLKTCDGFDGWYSACVALDSAEWFMYNVR